MIKSSDIVKMLKNNIADLNKQQIEEIIEAEMKKSESEMDAVTAEWTASRPTSDDCRGVNYL